MEGEEMITASAQVERINANIPRLKKIAPSTRAEMLDVVHKEVLVIYWGITSDYSAVRGMRKALSNAAESVVHEDPTLARLILLAGDL